MKKQLPDFLIVAFGLALAGCCSPDWSQKQTATEPCFYRHDPGLKDSPKLFPVIDLMEKGAFYLGMPRSDIEKIFGDELRMTNEVEKDGEEEGYVQLFELPKKAIQMRQDVWMARFRFDKNGKLTLYYVSNERRWKK